MFVNSLATLFLLQQFPSLVSYALHSRSILDKAAHDAKKGDHIFSWRFLKKSAQLLQWQIFLQLL